MFSIIIPTYNEKNNIKSCLTSILACKNQEDISEIIIIDDGNDKIENEIKRIRCKKIILKKGAKKGRAFALNRGVNISNDKIIGVLDADCRAPKNWIKQAKKVMKNYDAISGPYHMRENANMIEISNQIVSDFFENLFPKGITNKITGGNFFIKKNIIKNINFNTNIKGLSVDLKKYKVCREQKLFVYHYGEPKKIKELFLQRKVWGGSLRRIYNNGKKISLTSKLRLIYSIFLISSIIFSPFLVNYIFIYYLLIFPLFVIFLYGLFNIKKYDTFAVFLSPFFALIRMLFTTYGFLFFKKNTSVHWRK